MVGGPCGLMLRDAASKYRLLAKSGVLRVLVALYENGPMPIHRLSRYGIGSGTAYRAAREATLMGLTRLYECGASTCVDLTERGRRAAQYLAKALEVLSEAVKAD